MTTRMTRAGGAGAALLAATLTLAMPAPARAQQDGSAQEHSDATEREVVRLRREVARLRQDLAEADARIRELEKRKAELESLVQRARETISELRRSLRDGPEPSPQPQQPRVRIPDEPLASPWSMFRELRARYEAEFGSMPAPQNESGMRARREEIRSWCMKVSEKLAGRATWLVRVVEFAEPDRSRRAPRAWVELLDPASREVIGRPTEVEINSGFRRAVERDRFPLWEATVNFEPGARFNPDRTERGAFNVPPYIGPMVEFRPEISIVRHTGVQPAEGDGESGEDDADGQGGSIEDADAGGDGEGNGGTGRQER